jgi:hypothetical protein
MITGRDVEVELAEQQVVDDQPQPSSDFEIVTPRQGDILRAVPGVPVEYSTVPLRAANAGGAVRWFINDREVRTARLPLVPGTHRIRAINPLGVSSEITVRVEQ